MVKKIGIIGISEGNGHPYSFSAIINGFNHSEFSKCGWLAILDYLEKKDKTEFGVEGLQVSAVWTQSPVESEKIAKASNINVVCVSLDEMESLVDGVIIARDDWTSHFEIALGFLQKGKHVFVDKPLSLSIVELREFLPYLYSGKLMSCAALRYAAELDEYRSVCTSSEPKIINATVISDWPRYAVHLLDGIFSGVEFNVESVFVSGISPRVAILNCPNKKIVINCLGESERTFNISAYFENKKVISEVNDNFIAFKRTLSHFRDMIFSGTPPIDPTITLGIMKVLIAGNISCSENRLVYLNEIQI